MPKIDKDILKQKAQSQDNTWFSKGGNRSRVKRFLKIHQLEDDLLFDLWSIRSIRYDLINLQYLPNKILIEIITCAGFKKRNITKAMYIEALLKQKITSNIVTQYIEKNELELYFVAWEMIPKTMLLYGNWYDFLNIVTGQDKDDLYEKENSFTILEKERKGAIISLVRVHPEKLEEIVKFISCCSSPLIYEFITTLCKSIFFPDKIISFMRTNLEHIIFSSIMDILISRNNCSINMKARFLLEK